MFISGFTFVRNAVKFDYPVVESIRSLLPLCDELIVNVGKSEDATLSLIRSINDPKIVILESVWDEANRSGGNELARQTDIALKACSGRWCMYLQADEVCHENDYNAIRDALKKYDDDHHIEGLLFNYIHFFGSFAKCYTNSPRFYRREIRAFKNHLSVRSYGDAQGFRRNGRKLTIMPVHATIYHYGWVKNPQTMSEKQRNLGKLWRTDAWVNSNIAGGDAIFSDVTGLDNFKGAHPAVMKERVKSQSWKFDPPQNAVAPGRLKGFSYTVEKFLKSKGIGEYRNYHVAKPAKEKSIPRDFDKICLVRIRSIGDTLLTTPAFRHLKKAFPKMHIALVIEPKCLDVVRSNPYVDEVIIYHRGIRSLATLWQIRKKKFDVTIDFLGNMRSAITSFLSGSKTRIGLFEHGRTFAYTHKILGKPESYVGQQNLEFLRPLGIFTEDVSLDIFPGENETASAKRFFGSNGLSYGNVVGIFPTASWCTKQWPAEYYAALGKRIVVETNKKVVLFWGPAEKGIVENIARQIGSDAILIEPADFLTVAAIFKGCKAAIGNDSSFSHLAIAAGIPTVTILGPTSKGTWGPSNDVRHVALCADLPCVPCNKRICATMECMKKLKVETVYRALARLLDTAGR